MDFDSSDQFIRFVDKTQQRFGKQNGDGNGDRMKIFNLSTVNKTAHHITRWIGIALDNRVEHLVVEVFKDSSQLPCLIPDRVLSAYWLKSLKLDGYNIYIPLGEGSRVDLPSLTSLCISFSDNIRDEQLQKLLSGCPALEGITLSYCELLSKVDIFDNPNLETLEVTVSKNTRADHVAIMVSAPNLKSLDYACDWNYRGDIVVKIHNSPKLKTLRIYDWNKSDVWFHKFIAQFPLIENLTIHRCNALRKIRISNPLLEKINIRQCYNLEDVVISSKKLASFFLVTRPSSISNPYSIQMEMDNPPSDCTAQIFAPNKCDLMMEASWYCKLNEFLTRPYTFKRLNIVVIAFSAADGDMKGEDLHEKLPFAACNIEKLRLVINAPSSCQPHILNGLLSSCHPTTIQLDGSQGNAFVKLVCEELANRENNGKCWCNNDFKCWKHQLKEVKIEKIKGIKLEEDLDWDALFDLLPTLEDENDIYFKLMW